MGIHLLFPYDFEYPIRIEFFDDEIDSIRIYDPENQRSIDNITEVIIMPAREFIYSRERVINAIDKIKKDVKICENRKNQKFNENKEELVDRAQRNIENFREGIYFDGDYQYLPYMYDEFANITETLTTDNNGSAGLDLNLSIGTYPVNVTYIGDKYKSKNMTSTITVKYLDVILDSKDIAMDYRDGTSYIVRLTDANQNPIANQTINITLDKVYSLVSDANGIVSILIKLNPGDYKVSAAYGGNDIYNASKTENSIQINSKAKLTASNVNMYYSDSKYYKVRVYGHDGKVVGAGVKVKITINKKTYTRTTDKNGYASMKISLTPKTYTVKATCYGVTKSSKIVVKKVLTAKNIAKKKAKKIKFSAKLAKGKKVLSNKNVKFKIKGKTYTVKTNKKGIATVTLKNLKVGKYTIYTYYGKSYIKNQITIKK